MWGSQLQKTSLVAAAEALPGRQAAIVPEIVHPLLGLPLTEVPSGAECIQLGMGCFWGAERRFWQLQAVVNTAVGYAGGYTPNPGYEEVCSGLTGHAEVVKVVYTGGGDTLRALLRCFWEAHDPTQGMRQGNDIGTQYRSCIYVETAEQLAQAEASRQYYQQRLNQAERGVITTEIRRDVPFYFAEDYHQQYLFKHPQGYCGLQGTGISCALD